MHWKNGSIRYGEMESIRILKNGLNGESIFPKLMLTNAAIAMNGPLNE